MFIKLWAKYETCLKVRIRMLYNTLPGGPTMTDFVWEAMWRRNMIGLEGNDLHETLLIPTAKCGIENRQYEKSKK